MSGSHVEDRVDLISKNWDIGRLWRMKGKGRKWSGGAGMKLRRIRIHQSQKPKFGDGMDVKLVATPEKRMARRKA